MISGGYAYVNKNRSGYLLTRGSNSPKLRKGPGWYESAVLHLSPHTSAEAGVNLCPWSSEGCRTSCLNTAGRGRMHIAQNARRHRTMMFAQHKPVFLDDLNRELENLKGRASKSGWKKPVARLNGTSDIAWEKYLVPQLHETIQFWDYTKVWYRMERLFRGDFPSNYHLTYSRSEDTHDSRIDEVIENNFNVAVVFDTPKTKALPTEWMGYEVIDGRLHDYRFRDPKGVIVGLSALGAARNDRTGFVVRLEN